ncbi:structural maintenance of chromosomes protein 4-like [Athalia rosae]|uniref:structural maintenance of chromosomes protein 4-like n=1 Tax=Athalia rosae TaxID=37344 RepID=UPI00203487EF|nr:structural maintenance of chromosomes protein 4-like [Athalia rosae]XP_048510547.1 structural maintenance of chromosomes protein 4-like [Athalia rosae]
MDNNTQNSCANFLKNAKNRIEILRDKCSTAQENSGEMARKVSCIDKKIDQAERELSDVKSQTKGLQEMWKNTDVEIEKTKWIQEKTLIVLESNRKKNEIRSKTMDVIGENYVNLTTRAFKTVRQEAEREMINMMINSQNDMRRELQNKLQQLRRIKSETETNLAEAEIQSMEARARKDTVLRLQRKLKDSEALRSEAAAKLRKLKDRLADL